MRVGNDEFARISRGHRVERSQQTSTTQPAVVKELLASGMTSISVSSRTSANIDNSSVEMHAANRVSSRIFETGDSWTRETEDEHDAGGRVWFSCRLETY